MRASFLCRHLNSYRVPNSILGSCTRRLKLVEMGYRLPKHNIDSSGRDEALNCVAGRRDDVERYAGVVCGGHRIRVWHDRQQNVPKDWRL
jgi:hypothetical protein